MGTVYQAGGDDKGVIKKTVPKLMARVKIEREMEALRRERNRREEAMKNERQRAMQSGIPVNEAILTMHRKEIGAVDNKIEEKILEIQKLEG